MPNLRTINAKSGNANILIGAQSYATVFTNQRFEWTVAQDEEGTFADEPNSKFGEGPSIGRCAFAGILKEGDAEAGPILPLPQNAATTMRFGGGSNTNQLVFNANYTRLVVERTAMNKGVLAAEAVIVSAVTKSWNVAT